MRVKCIIEVIILVKTAYIRREMTAYFMEPNWNNLIAPTHIHIAMISKVSQVCTKLVKMISKVVTITLAISQTLIDCFLFMDIYLLKLFIKKNISFTQMKVKNQPKTNPRYVSNWFAVLNYCPANKYNAPPTTITETIMIRNLYHLSLTHRGLFLNLNDHILEWRATPTVIKALMTHKIRYPN